MREFVHIDDAVNALPKAEQKALSKPNAMAYNRLKQTIKKELKNDEFSSIVESFRANPVEESEEESEEESTEESTEEVSSTSEYDSGSESESDGESESYEESESYATSGSESESDETSSDSEESSDSEFGSDSSSSDSEVEVNPKLTGRAKWVLQPSDIQREAQKAAMKKQREDEKRKKEEEKRKKDDEKRAENESSQEEIKEETYETPEKLIRAVFSVLSSKERKSRSEERGVD